MTLLHKYNLEIKVKYKNYSYAVNIEKNRDNQSYQEYEYVSQWIDGSQFMPN